MRLEPQKVTNLIFYDVKVKSKNNILIFFLTANRQKLKVRKFDGLSSSRSGDIEENYRGAIMPPPPRLIRIKERLYV